MLPSSRWASFRNSFQFKLFFIFTLLTFLISSLLSTLYVVTEIHETRRSAVERLQLRVKYLADSVRLPLYAENRVMLQQLAEEAAKAPEISAVVISTPSGKVLSEVRTANASLPAETITHSLEVYSNPLVDSVESTMIGGQDATVSLLGTVRIERGTSDLSRNVRRVVIFSTGIAIVFWLLVSLLCHLTLRRLTASFNSLMHGINAMQGGNLASRIMIESDDEPGRAARAVNSLAAELQQRSEEISLLNEERLEFERQMLHSQKLESLGIMAGGIAHDFNNLLQSLLGNIEMASMKLDSGSEAQKFITNAITSGKRAAHLTDMMLAYTGKRFIAKRRVNLNELVRENVEILMSSAITTVTTKLDLLPEIPLILADEANLQQIVMNLISNAAESIENKAGLITLATGIEECDKTSLEKSLLTEKPEPGRFVFLEVSDNGCGMSEETVKRIFDPFFTTKFTGRGLGMSAVLGIIKSHNGALFVRTGSGEGTTFRVLLPISESAAAEPDSALAHTRRNPLELDIERVEEVSKSTLEEKPLSGLVLVVDDEKSVLKICSKMIELCGFRVITACDGVEAVAKYHEHADEISIVLLDLTMPNMDGITAMAEIYSINPAARVIIASGFHAEEVTGRITGQAPSGVIRKPYNMAALKAELGRILREH
jgi:signal transduction histidine kinase